VVEGASPPAGPFDVRTIKYLIKLMGRHDLTEVDLREGEHRIRLRRGSPRGTIVEGNVAGAPVAPAPPPAPAAAPPDPAARKYIEIKSPTPGTFYASPNPESESYVKVGSKVGPDTVVCIIEAMKVFNEIQAECSGTIVAILAQNQQAVEYGQVLFHVDPSA
jgi:acetyl-CoA carboxylase biotin carboxyl carrier protein